MRKSEQGLTLVDVLIASVLILVIVGLAFPGFKVANDTITRSGQKSRLDKAADRIGKELVKEIRTGQVVAIGGESVPPFVDIRPPRAGIALDQIADEGTVPWGTETHRLGFRQTAELDESKEKVDVNGDGDETDRFALGILELTTPKGTRPVTQRGRVILALPSYAGDVNGDGVGDPLFVMESRRFTLNLHLVFRDEKGHYHKAALDQSIYLRNIQE